MKVVKDDVIGIHIASYIGNRLNFIAKKNNEILCLSKPNKNIGDGSLSEQYWHYRWKNKSGENIKVQPALFLGLYELIKEGYSIEAELK